jgi:hypothetical protein
LGESPPVAVNPSVKGDPVSERAAMMAALLKERLRMRLLKIPEPISADVMCAASSRLHGWFTTRRIAYTACPHGPAASRLGGDGTHFVAFRSTRYCGSAIALTHFCRPNAQKRCVALLGQAAAEPGWPMSPWVNLDKTPNEHNESAIPPKPAVKLTSVIGRDGPTHLTSPRCRKARQHL